MYHPEGCTTCEAYAAHAVSALCKGELVSSQNPVAKALDDAFPWYGTGYAEDATDESRREIDELRADNNKLREKYERLEAKYVERNNLLDEERVLRTVAEKKAGNLQNQLDEYRYKYPLLSAPTLDASTVSHASAYDNHFQYDDTGMSTPSQQGSPSRSGPSSGPSRTAHKSAATRKEAAAPYKVATSRVSNYTSGVAKSLLPVKEKLALTPLKGKGKAKEAAPPPLPQPDPPFSETGLLPRPLGKIHVPQWYESIPIDDPKFKNLLSLAKATQPGMRSAPQKAALKRQRLHEKATKPEYFAIAEDTPEDLKLILNSWIHNPEGVPPPVRDLDDGLDLDDVDVWEWAWRITPRPKYGGTWETAAQFKKMLWSIFSEPMKWDTLVGTQFRPPAKPNLRSAATSVFIWTDSFSSVTEKEIAQWLGMHAGVYPLLAHKTIEPYAACLITGICYNNPARIAAEPRLRVETRRAIEAGTYVHPSQLAERPTLLNRIDVAGAYTAGQPYTGEVPVGEPVRSPY